MKRWLWAIALVLLTSSLAVGGEIETPQSILYPYKSQVVFQDEFLSGNVTSGTIGSLGWGFTNGTTTSLASETNRPGILRRDTGAGAGTITVLRLNINTSTMFRAGVNHSLLWMVRLNTNDADTTVRLGVANSAFAVSPPGDGIYFEKLAGDTNWFCVTRTGGVETRTDSTVAVNTSFNAFAYHRTTSGVTFQLNNTTVCTHTTNISTSLLVPWTLIENSAAAAKTLDHDYFQFRLTGLTR